MIPLSYYENGYSSYEEFLGTNLETSKIISQVNQRAVEDSTFEQRQLGKQKLFNYVNDNLIIGGYDYFEFGVAHGGSFELWSKFNKINQLYGFDTFTGLPDKWHRCFTSDINSKINWAISEKGEYSVNGNLPNVGYNTTLIAGLFQETLYPFMIKYTNKNKVIYIDSDLYSSALFILTTMHPYLKNNDIIIFDELCDRLNEFKAFNDYIMSYYMKDKLRLEACSYETFAFKVINK